MKKTRWFRNQNVGDEKEEEMDSEWCESRNLAWTVGVEEKGECCEY